MTLPQLAKEKALDIVFTSRPNLPTDWDTVMAANFNDRDGFGDDFVVLSLFRGYSNDFICATIQRLHEDLFSMAHHAIDKVYELSCKESTTTTF
jgi:hypothetical protein